PGPAQQAALRSRSRAATHSRASSHPSAKATFSTRRASTSSRRRAATGGAAARATPPSSDVTRDLLPRSGLVQLPLNEAASCNAGSLTNQGTWFGGGGHGMFYGSSRYVVPALLLFATSATGQAAPRPLAKAPTVPRDFKGKFEFYTVVLKIDTAQEKD